MYCKLTTQEKLKDLRVARHLTLKELSEKVGIASSTLGEYENNETKDITSYSLEALSKFYGVSIDYLLGRTENAEERLTPLEELHLTDDAVAILKSGQVNTRLLSEIITHKDFTRMMIDAEIYVDRIAESRFRDMNTLLESCRQMVITQKGADPDDLYMRTLQVGQISETDFFGKTIHEDMMGILSSIREKHIPDTTTADTNGSELVLEAIKDVADHKGTAEEQQAAYLLRQIGIDYRKLNEAEFVTMMNIFRKSSLLYGKGKGMITHGRGKRKKR